MLLFITLSAEHTAERNTLMVIYIAALPDQKEPHPDSVARELEIQEHKNNIALLCNQAGIALCTNGAGLSEEDQQRFIYHRAAQNDFFAVTLN